MHSKKQTDTGHAWLGYKPLACPPPNPVLSPQDREKLCENPSYTALHTIVQTAA